MMRVTHNFRPMSRASFFAAYKCVCVCVELVTWLHPGSLTAQWAPMSPARLPWIPCVSHTTFCDLRLWASHTISRVQPHQIPGPATPDPGEWMSWLSVTMALLLDDLSARLAGSSLEPESKLIFTLLNSLRVCVCLYMWSSLQRRHSLCVCYVCVPTSGVISPLLALPHSAC